MIFAKYRVQRFLPPALLFGAGLFVAACCHTCPKYIGENGAEPVNILVTWDAGSKQIIVFPDTARLCEERQFPRWALLGAPEGTTIGISFPEGGSPFPSREEKTGATAKGGTVVTFPAPRPGTAGKRYKYTVTLTVPGVTPPPTLDPNLEIWR